MFKKLQERKDINLLVEEKLYEHVADELEAGEIRKGLWAKASAQASSSSETEVRRKYIQLRVEHLQAEGRLAKQFLEEVEGAITDEDSSRAKMTESAKSDEEDAIYGTKDDFKIGLIVMTVIVVLMIVAGLLNFL